MYGLDPTYNAFAACVSVFVPSHLPDLHDVVRGTAAHAVTTVEAFGGIWQQLSGLGVARASSYFAALTLHRGISKFKTKAAVAQHLAVWLQPAGV